MSELSIGQRDNGPQICPRTGGQCFGSCKGPREVKFTVNGQTSSTFEPAKVCGRQDRLSPSPTSVEGILGVRALDLISRDD